MNADDVVSTFELPIGHLSNADVVNHNIDGVKFWEESPEATKEHFSRWPRILKIKWTKDKQAFAIVSEGYGAATSEACWYIWVQKERVPYTTEREALARAMLHMTEAQYGS